MSRTRLCFIARVGVVMGAASLTMHVWALKAAGLTGTSPAGGEAFAGLVNTLYSNVLWLVAISLGLLLVTRIAALMFGSITAIDSLGKIVVGILLILVGIPAILK